VDSVSKWTGESSGFSQQVDWRIKKAFNQQVDWWTQWVQSTKGSVNAIQVQSAKGTGGRQESLIDKWIGKPCSIDNRIGGRTSIRSDKVQSASGPVNTNQEFNRQVDR
jgi:hypothetical protein